MANSKCNKCDPRPCKCHPCYDVKVGDCNKNDCCDEEITADPVDPCNVPEICTTGCEEVISADCVVTNCGLTLQQVLDMLIDPATCLPYANPPTCPDTTVSTCSYLGIQNFAALSGVTSDSWVVTAAPATSVINIGQVLPSSFTIEDVESNAGLYTMETTIDGCKTIFNLDLYTIVITSIVDPTSASCVYNSSINDISFEVLPLQVSGYEVSAQFEVTDSCLNDGRGGILETIGQRNVYNPATTIDIGTDVFSSIATGGFVETIKVARDDGFGNVTYYDIDLSPTGAVLSGCAGTTSPAALTYNQPDIATFETALDIALKNGICTATGASLSEIHIVVDVTPIFSGGAVGRAVPKFSTPALHNPDTVYIGIDTTNSFLKWRVTQFPSPPQFPKETTLNSRTLLTASHVLSSEADVIEIPCGELCHLGLVNGSPGSYTFNSITFENDLNNLTVFNSCYGDGAVVTEIECFNRVLEATLVTGCNCEESTVTYLWSTGETTASIEISGQPDQPVSYFVDVTCSGLTTRKSIVVEF